MAVEATDNYGSDDRPPWTARDENGYQPNYVYKH
jgi:hypothetical protein